MAAGSVYTGVGGGGRCRPGGWGTFIDGSVYTVARKRGRGWRKEEKEERGSGKERERERWEELGKG